MKYRITLLLTFLLTATLALPAQGTVERAKERSEKKANKRVDNKIDQEVDKALNAIEGLFKKKKKGDAESSEPDTTGDEASGDEAATAFMNMLSGNDEDFEPFENEQPFSVVMTVDEEKRGKTETSTIHLGATRTKIAMVTTDEGQRTQVVFDTQDGKTTTVITDKKGETKGFRMRMPNLGGMMEAASKEVGDIMEVERTNERKTIDGYDCELVLVTNTKENTVTRSWITRDLDISSQEVFGSVARMMGGKGGTAPGIPPGFEDLVDGFPIMSTSVDGNKTYTMNMSDIRTGNNVDQSLFDTDNVPIEELGFGG